MADVLTLAQAREALNWDMGRNPERNDVLLASYIPTVTTMVTALCGELPDPVPPQMVMAGGIILAHLWNANKQGRSTASTVRGEDVAYPVGFAIPRRAEVLLAPYAIPTNFAFA